MDDPLVEIDEKNSPIGMTFELANKIAWNPIILKNVETGH